MNKSRCSMGSHSALKAIIVCNACSTLVLLTKKERHLFCR